MSVVIVGEAPNRDALERPFDSRTRSGRRLAELLGVVEVSEAFAVVNLVDRWPGRSSHGSAFPAGLARANARALWFSLLPEARLLIVGARAATAFGVGQEYLRWTPVTVSENGDRLTRRVAVLPHPSGGRWWTDATNQAAAARFARQLRRYA